MTMALNIQVLPPGATEAREAAGDDSISVSGTPQPTESKTVQLKESLPKGAIRGAIPESAARDKIRIGSLLDHRLRMQESLTLEIEQEGEFYIAKYEELNEFGYGLDPISAVQDVRITIAELYWQLKKDRERLGSDLAKTWQRLSELVSEV